MSPLQIEQLVRDEFDKLSGNSTNKKTLRLSSQGPSHEFDIYEINKVIGGISTSTWFNKAKEGKKGTSNSSGQDRAATELLWLDLWPGNERRIHILTDQEMAIRLFKKFSGAKFQRSIEIHYFEINKKIFTHVGTL